MGRVWGEQSLRPFVSRVLWPNARLEQTGLRPATQPWTLLGRKTKAIKESMSFSRSTIIEALGYLEGWSTNEFDRYLLRFSLEDVTPASMGSKPTRINGLIAYFISNPQQNGPGGSNIIMETIEFIFKKHSNCGGFSSATLIDSFPALSHSLNLDGYSINDNGTLNTIVPVSLPIAPKQSVVEQLLIAHGFTVADGHLKQALNAHTRGDWAAANSQMRVFVESLFDSFADKLLTAPLPTTSHLRKEKLARLDPPFIDPTLNEWDFSQPKGFMQGFWNRLHPSGSHPGLSDEDDCTFRLQLVFIVAHRFLKRFDNYP